MTTLPKSNRNHPGRADDTIEDFLLKQHRTPIKPCDLQREFRMASSPLLIPSDLSIVWTGRPNAR